MSISRPVSRPCNAITVVVVDDDASFRSGVAANLEDDGHAVFEYEDPRDVPSSSLDAADLVVSDYQMAGVDGLTFADGIHARRPELNVVLATAYWTVEMEAEVTARRAFVRLCRKPVDYEDLHLLVHELAAER
jgi:two-component system, NtrC family, response regulator AtoC